MPSIKTELSKRKKYIRDLLKLSDEIKKYPDLAPEYYLRLARAYRVLGVPLKSIKYLKKALKINPIDPNMFYELGNSYRVKKNYQMALKYFAKAFKLKPNYLYKLKAAEINLETSKYLVAKKILEKIITVEKNNADALSLLGVVYGAGLKKYADAIKLFKKTLRLQSDNHTAKVGLGRCLIELKRYKEAKAIFQREVKSHKDCVTCLHNLANIYDREHKHKRALKLFTRIQKINDDPYIRMRIAIDNSYLSFQKKNFKKVIRLVPQILSERPDFCDGYSMLGRSYFYLQQISKAVRVFKRQIRNCSDCGMGEFNLGELYWKNKSKELAVKYFLRSRKKPGSKALWADLDDYLEKSKRQKNKKK